MKRHMITTGEMQEIRDTEHVIQIASSTSGERKRISMYIFREIIEYRVSKGGESHTCPTLTSAIEKYNEM